MERRIAVLTKSSKHKNYCVAGIDVDTGEWIRLVSDNEATHGALSRRDITYQDGSVCEPLDVVQVVVKREFPSTYQPENILIDEEFYFKKLGTTDINDVIRMHPLEKNEYLYLNSIDYITEDEMDDIGYSLTLIEVKNLTIHQVIREDESVRTKASFVYEGKLYNKISVTDYNFYDVDEGSKFNNAILVVSLPDAPFPYDRYYKFIAKIYLV